MFLVFLGTESTLELVSQVLKQHKKAEEAIVKQMRSQGSAAINSHELRATWKARCLL